MPSARLKVVFGTLRARLTVWNTVVVLGLVVLTLVGVREGLRRMTLARLDEFLDEEMDEIEDDIRDRAPHWEEIHRDLNRKALDHSRRHLFVQLFSPAGDVLWSSDQTPAEDWAGRPLGGPGGPIVRARHRFLERHPRGLGLVIRVGVSTQQAETDLAEFTESMLAVGGIVVLLTPAVGYLLAGRATRPISRIIDTAARLHPARLDERLPVRGTHDELDRLSQTINGLLDRIARYLAQNREFSADAAHELRSPLAAIQSSLEVTLLGDRTAEEYKEELLALLDEFGQLRVLVNQLLLLAEGDAGQLCPVRQPVRVDDTARRALDMFQAVAEVGGVELAADRLDQVVVVADGPALRQVVNNLVDNALKNTPPGGRVGVEVRRDPGADECVVRVRDTGVGIGADDLPHLFRRFYRADKARPRDPSHRGTGLGLCICRAIVEAHAGTIEVESTPGRGAAFTVRLPGGDRPAG